MQIRGQRARSPQDMFTVGILQRGARGLNLRPQANLDEVVDNPTQYGVDWAAHRDQHLMRHLHEHNPSDHDTAESFCLPEHMARVECEPPNCPFTAEEMVVFRASLAGRVIEHVHRRDMPSRRIVWCHAFAIAFHMRAQQSIAIAA
jgi:hypothetical protein